MSIFNAVTNLYCLITGIGYQVIYTHILLECTSLNVSRSFYLGRLYIIWHLNRGFPLRSTSGPRSCSLVNRQTFLNSLSYTPMILQFRLTIQGGYYYNYVQLRRIEVIQRTHNFLFKLSI